MDSSILWMLLLQVVLIALNAVFACAEIAVISVNENKVEKMAAEGNRKAGKLLNLVSDPSRFLATIQVAITLSGFLGSAFAADNFSEYLVDWLVGLGVGISPDILDTIAVIVITIILSYFTLVLVNWCPNRWRCRKRSARPFRRRTDHRDLESVQAARFAAHSFYKQRAAAARDRSGPG